MTDSAQKEFTIAFEVKVGDYTIAPSQRPGYVWISCRDEGGEFEAALLERCLARFFGEHF